MRNMLHHDFVLVPEDLKSSSCRLFFTYRACYDNPTLLAINVAFTGLILLPKLAMFSKKRKHIRYIHLLSFVPQCANPFQDTMSAHLARGCAFLSLSWVSASNVLAVLKNLACPHLQYISKRQGI
jgi:hypothetical protein